MNSIRYGWESIGRAYSTTSKWVYGMQWKTNDIIEMIVDFSKAQISYKLNDIDQGIAYNDIMKGEKIEYRLSVCTWFSGCSVQILDYKVQ